MSEQTLRKALELAKAAIGDACHATAIYGDEPPKLYREALSAIEAALSAPVAQPVAWIPIREKPPSVDGSQVLACYEDGSMDIYLPSLVIDYAYWEPPLTHWMPLPAPPTEPKDKP